MSKFIGKMISVKKNQNTMTQWVRSVRDMAGVGSQDEDEEEALSLKDELQERVEVRKGKTILRKMTRKILRMMTTTNLLICCFLGNHSIFLPSSVATATVMKMKIRMRWKW